jgi:hypothetical protein
MQSHRREGAILVVKVLRNLESRYQVSNLELFISLST